MLFDHQLPVYLATVHLSMYHGAGFPLANLFPLMNIDPYRSYSRTEKSKLAAWYCLSSGSGISHGLKFESMIRGLNKTV